MLLLVVLPSSKIPRIQFTARSESVNTEEKKKGSRRRITGEFLPLRFDETPTRAVRLRGVLLFLFCAGHFCEKIEAFLGSSYFLHSKEEGSTRVKTHLFFFPLENVRFGILLLHSKSLRELTLRAEEKSRSFVEHSLRRLHFERDFDDDDDDDDDVEEKRSREKMETAAPPPSHDEESVCLRD